jgi:hypothetical protein
MTNNGNYAPFNTEDINTSVAPKHKENESTNVVRKTILIATAVVTTLFLVIGIILGLPEPTNKNLGRVELDVWLQGNVKSGEEYYFTFVPTKDSDYKIYVSNADIVSVKDEYGNKALAYLLLSDALVVTLYAKTTYTVTIDTKATNTSIKVSYW